LRVRSVPALVVCLTLLTALAPPVCAQNRFDSWNTENGLPQNSVNDILQTRDGYLWLATFGGLVRFDGIRFAIFDRSTPGIESQRLTALHQDRNGVLWAASEDGMLVQYDGNRFTTYSSRDGLPPVSAVRIEEDEEGCLCGRSNPPMVSVSYAEAVKLIDQSDVPQQVKDASRRNSVFEASRLAVARGDLATARTKAAEYATLIAPRKAPFEARQLQELRGSIALAEKRGADAVKELSGANQQDPKVLYLTAVAFRESGDARQAAVFAKKAARFNGLAFNYAYVRTRAAALIGPATE
jgi:hypothetical protein